MRDHDGAADDQAHGERFLELGRGHAALGALDDVVADAVVAAQHQRGDEAEQLFGLGGQRAVLVRFTVEAEETLDHPVVAGQNALVGRNALGLELVEGFGHGCLLMRVA